MSTAVRLIQARFLAGSLASLALFLAAGPALAAPGQAEAGYQRSSLSASQRALAYDHRTAPKNPGLIGRFNAADHRPPGRAATRQPAPAPTLFLDLKREMEVELDVWYGKAGLQINW